MNVAISKWMINASGAVDASVNLEFFFDSEMQKYTAQITCHGSVMTMESDWSKSMLAREETPEDAFAALAILCSRDLAKK